MMMLLRQHLLKTAVRLRHSKPHGEIQNWISLVALREPQGDNNDASSPTPYENCCQAEALEAIGSNTKLDFVSRPSSALGR